LMLLLVPVLIAIVEDIKSLAQSALVTFEES
jgi:hypothetical protein